MRVESVDTKTTGNVQGGSQLDLSDWQQHTRSFDSFGLYITFPSILNTGNGASQSVTLTFALVRTQTDPEQLMPLPRRTVHEVNSDITINLIKPVGTIVSEANWQRRLWGVLFVLFAGIALLLAAVGLYGVMSYLVSQRTREIGMRMALGARGVDVWRLIVGQGLKVVALGVVVGLVAAMALARVMTSLLFGITATDPLTYLGVASLLVIVAVFACFVPARRAAKVDPMIALRAE